MVGWCRNGSLFQDRFTRKEAADDPSPKGCCLLFQSVTNTLRIAKIRLESAIRTQIKKPGAGNRYRSRFSLPGLFFMFVRLFVDATSGCDWPDCKESPSFCQGIYLITFMEAGPGSCVASFRTRSPAPAARGDRSGPAWAAWSCKPSRWQSVPSGPEAPSRGP